MTEKLPTANAIATTTVSTPEHRPNRRGDFIWYDLLTSDADAAQRFYGAVLGWSFQDTGQPDRDYRMFSASGEGIGGFMGLTNEMTASGLQPGWIGYIKVDSVDAAAKALETMGGKVHRQPWDIPAVGRVALAADPQGALFYVMKPTPPAGHPDAVSQAFAYDKPMIGHCAWNELETTDQAAAVDFYTGLFGWRQDGDMDMGLQGKYQFLYQGEKMMGAVMTQPDAMRVPMWTTYFRVASIDASLATIKAQHGQVLQGPHEIPGGDCMLAGMDPQGALFSLVGAR